MAWGTGGRPVIANIEARGIARRRRQGFAGLAAGAVATLVLAFTGAAWTGLATFPFFWAGALGVLQAHEKT